MNPNTPPNDPNPLESWTPSAQRLRKGHDPETPEARGLLAIDLGVRTGLAYFDGHGQLQWVRSSNFGNLRRLKQGAYGIVAREVPLLTHLVAEGDRNLGDIWLRLAAKRGAATRLVGAEVWRQALMAERHQRTGADAKQHADAMAREVIAQSGAPGVKSLRHDAAEAILIGFWAVGELGWRA